MRQFLVLTSMLLMILAASTTLAQERPKETPELPPDFAHNDQKNRTKAPPHAEMAKEAGRWKVTTQFAPMFGGATEVGEVNMESVLDGKFLLARGTGQMMGQPMETLGIFGFDTLADEYTAVNLNSIYTTMYDMRGKMREDGVIEYHGIMKDAMSPQGRPYRAEKKREGPDSFVLTVFDGTGEAEFVVLTMTYERLK